jgi:hypothetical protein
MFAYNGRKVNFSAEANVMERFKILALVIPLLIALMACTFAGSGTPISEPAPTEAAAQVPTREPPTIPPVAPSAVPTQAPPTPIPPTETPTGSGPGGCVLAEQFVADVTIPDGTVLAAGSPFVKTWRVRNSGTCPWENYKLIFAAGEQMGGPASVNVNTTPPGATVDVTVNLIAPATPGQHKGGWRFQATNGSVFGSLTVIIEVPAPATPTFTPVPPAVSNWSGEWISNCGAFNCGTVVLVQNGTAINGTFAGGGVILGTLINNRLTGTWSRSGSSGTIDWWMGGSGKKWRGNYNAVNGWCGYRAGETEPTPCSVGTFSGDWNSVGQDFTALLSIYQDGDRLVGTLKLPSGDVRIDGTIDGVKAGGVWNQPGGTSNAFAWYLLNAVQFNGNYDGSKKWCGYRNGSSAPAECFKP